MGRRHRDGYPARGIPDRNPPSSCPARSVGWSAALPLREAIRSGPGPSELLGAIMACVHGRRRSSLIAPAVVGQSRMCCSSLWKSRSLRTYCRVLPSVQVPTARITATLQLDGRQSVRSGQGSYSKPPSTHQRQLLPAESSDLSAFSGLPEPADLSNFFGGEPTMNRNHRS